MSEQINQLKLKIEEAMRIIATDSKRWNSIDDRYIYSALMDAKDFLESGRVEVVHE